MVIDQTSIDRMRLLYPPFETKLRLALSNHFDLHRLQHKVVETLRSFHRQELLYRIGRSVPGQKVTDAPPGQGYHHYGLAGDIAFCGADPYLAKLDRKKKEKVWSDLGECFKEQGLVWGGDWNGNGRRDRNDSDLGHCELHIPGMTPRLMETSVLSLRSILPLWGQFDRILGRPNGEGYSRPTDYCRPPVIEKILEGFVP